MKTSELALGIIIIIAFFVMRYPPLWSSFTHEEWHPFQMGLSRNPVGTVVDIVLALSMLFGGGFMTWLSSR